MLALLHELKHLLYLDALTTTGRTLGEEMAAVTLVEVPRELSCIQPFDKPLHASSSLVVLRGNIAPGGAVMKASASKDKRLLRHTGKAVVFANPADMARRLDDPELEVSADSVLVLQNIGPVGAPGMPEAGMIPIPRKLAEKGVTDMLRLSDGRMSGTAGGTIVLHISPEAADPASPLGVLRDGDSITCNVEERILHVDLTEEDIERRVERRKAELLGAESTTPWATRDGLRGYRGLYLRSVNQAQHGTDFDFMTAAGPEV